MLLIDKTMWVIAKTSRNWEVKHQGLGYGAVAAYENQKEKVVAAYVAQPCDKLSTVFASIGLLAQVSSEF